MKPVLLVISFYFPPYPRVGGRRWAKHVRHLLRQGQEVFVLAGDFSGKVSSWDEDIVSFSDRITRVRLKPAFKPWFETTLPKTIAQKIRWKLSLYSWKLRRPVQQGNYSDASLPNRDAFLSAARTIIREKAVTQVILSVGPYSYATLLHDLRKEFPQLKLILDYRDPWEEEFGSLTKRQQAFELKLQNALLPVTDLVLTVNDDISAHIRSLGAKNVITLPHSVDDDFLSLDPVAKTQVPDEPVVFVYGGELYGDMEQQIADFVDFLRAFRKISGRQTKAEFYSPYPSYESILNGEVKLYPVQPKKKYQEILMKSDFILLFKSPPITTTFFSSKFFELICLRKPVLFFGEKGKGSEFLTQRRLGFHIHKGNVQEIAQAVFANLQSKEIPDRSYDLTPHSFEAHTKDLVAHLHELQS